MRSVKPMAKTFGELLNGLDAAVFTGEHLQSVENRIALRGYLNRWDQEIDSFYQFDIRRLKKENLDLSVELDKLDPIESFKPRCDTSLCDKCRKKQEKKCAGGNKVTSCNQFSEKPKIKRLNL